MSPVLPTERIAHLCGAADLLRCGISIRPTSAMGQERRIGAVSNISALPPRADVGADIVERPLCGREQMQHYSITTSARTAMGQNIERTLSPMIYDIFWNYFGVEAEDLWVRRVDCHTYPMSFRSAECLDAGEILKPSASLLAEERLVHAEGVRVAMEECGWLVIALQFLGQRLDVVIIGGWLRWVRGTNAAKQSKIELLRSRWPIVLKSWIGLYHQHKPTAVVGFSGGKGVLHPCQVCSLALDMLGIHLRRAAEIVVAPDDMQGGKGYPTN